MINHSYNLFQVIIRSIQTEKISFPVDVYVKEIEFDTDGVAVITSENKSETVLKVLCWPEEVCWMFTVCTVVCIIVVVLCSGYY